MRFVMNVIDKSRTYDEITVGMSASRAKQVFAADVRLFAEATGDYNPAHFDEEFAKGTVLKGLAAHGVLTLGHLSAVFGMELPGPGAVFYGFDRVRFTGPVRIGDTVRSEVKAIGKDDTKKRVTFACQCWVDDKMVLVCEATLVVPKAHQSYP